MTKRYKDRLTAQLSYDEYGYLVKEITENEYKVEILCFSNDENTPEQQLITNMLIKAYRHDNTFLDVVIEIEKLAIKHGVDPSVVKAEVNKQICVLPICTPRHLTSIHKVYSDDLEIRQEFNDKGELDFTAISQDGGETWIDMIKDEENK